MKPITFSLQFRGQVAQLGEGLRKQASAPGCALVTSLTAEGPDGHFVWAPGDEAAVDRIRAAYDSYQHATAASRHRELVPDRFVDMMALAGTPDEVRAQVKRVMTVPEIARIILLPQNPGRGFIEREAILRTFAEQVMAHLG